MAIFEAYIDTLFKHEGGFANHPNDPGGATYLGITLYNWQTYGRDLDGDGDIDVNDLKAISKKDATDFYRAQFWNVLKADQLKSQELANQVFDHGVNAGTSRAAKMLQYTLNQKFGKNLAVDGVIGAKTIAAANSVDPQTLTDYYRGLREHYYRYRANDLPINHPLANFFTQSLKISPSNKASVFLRGWLKRVSDFGATQKKNWVSCPGCGCSLAITLQ